MTPTPQYTQLHSELPPAQPAHALRFSSGYQPANTEAAASPFATWHHVEIGDLDATTQVNYKAKHHAA